MIKLLILDDHPVVLEGTRTLLKDIDEIEIEISSNITDIMLKVQDHFFDIYLLDIHMPQKNGVQLAEEIKQIDPEARIILYTGYNITDYYHLLLNYTIDGIIDKTASKEQLLRVIYSAYNEELTVPNDFISYVKRFMDQDNNIFIGGIQEREIRILRLMSLGYTNKVIAAELDVTQRTVEKYIAKILSKLEVDSRIAAAIKAKELKLI
ncbi:response regulator transcription factor [Lysinibacillus xylanilyticus]|uniref:response regulator transcription factor n=1 Tax=Lysinibacillus xylanilyticus TaxID=582475 RepID=UPI00382CC3B8